MTFSEELDAERAQIMRAVRQASSAWAEAMRAHKLAPPDAGFAARLRALAEAAAAEQVTWEHAHAAGLLGRPVPGAEHAEPPYELRPGMGRRGPQRLWEQFDAAVGRLNHAIAGTSAAVPRQISAYLPRLISLPVCSSRWRSRAGFGISVDA